MPVSPVSVSNKTPHDSGSPRILVVGVSWLGDGVMSMPALAALRKRLPRAYIAMLAKPSVIDLWALFPGVDEVIPLQKGFIGMRDTIRAVRAGGFDFAYILPKSFRSALIPFLACVPGRRGMPGHGRDWMLTERAVLSDTAVRGHQSFEMADVLHVPHVELEPPPFLVIPDEARDRALKKLASAFPEGAFEGQLIAIFPGAAYGPAKRWPVSHFAEVAKRLVEEQGCRVLLLGSSGDREICDAVVRSAGAGTVSLAGETSFLELTGLLGLCRCVVSNDSGGMHLAAGLGIPVVGIFGLTDPAKTAPVGSRSQLLCAEGIRHSRDIDRDSPKARAAIASITVDAVMKSILIAINPVRSY